MRNYLLLALTAGIASAEVYDTLYDSVTWDNDNWRLTTTHLDQGHYQSRISLANGYLGINLAAAGPFFEVDTPVNKDMVNGWPLFQRRQTFATISGFWDSQPEANSSNFPWLSQYGGESVISGVPHWAGLVVKANDNVLDASVPSDQISGFSSTLDAGAGIMSWSYTWSPDDAPAVDVEYTAIVHKLHVNRAAVELKLTPSRDMDVTVVDVIDGDCAVRTNFAGKGYDDETATMWTSVQPHGIDWVTAYIYSTLVGDDTCDMSAVQQLQDDSLIGANKSSIAQSVKADLTAGKTTTISKFIGGASTDAFDDPKAVAKKASAAGAKSGFVNELHSHIEEWGTILTADSVDDYANPDGTLPKDKNIRELQITAKTNPFYILQNTVGPNAIKAAGNNKKLNINSIAVGGLTSDSYAGLIFWDADVWMHPGMVVSHPEHISAITNYRVDKHEQAKKNIKMAFSSSQNEPGQYSEGGAVYPWTSGRFGNCTAVGPCFDYEYHLNGDIGLSLINEWIATGHRSDFEKSRFPVYDDVAKLYSQTMTLNKKTGKYILKNATDPDEFANHVDNAGFTMALMKYHLQMANKFRTLFGKAKNKFWAKQAKKIEIPVDKEANLILEYESMNGTVSVKQADVVLIHDFLDAQPQYALSDLDYYAGKQSAAGPGMTYSVFSIAANLVSPSGCSGYTYDLGSSDPYIRAPWYQYSEQLLDNYQLNGGFHPAYPFLTGMGGATRVAVYGYLGLRLELDSFNVDPNLPPQIKNLRYRTIYWQGHAVSAYSNQTHTTLTRIHRSIEGANPEFAHKPIPVSVGNSKKVVDHLDFGSQVVVENRQIGQIKTWKNNLAQCRSAESPDSYTLGQFPIAAVDGAISTKWQPDTKANEPAHLTVRLPGPPFVPVSELRFDWAQSPPKSFTAYFHNTSISQHNGRVEVASQQHVTVSNPYQPKKVAEIVAYIGNSTNVTLDQPVWSGRYATLVIEGNQSGGDDAATVAEWGIIQEGGSKLM